MHRSISDLTQRIERVLLERLIPARYGTRHPVTISAIHLPGEPLSFAEATALPAEPFEVGSQWGPPWSTTWFHMTGEVPEHMAGRRVELLVDLGFGTGGPGFRSEALAYRADGTVLKGIEPRTAYVPVAAAATGGEELDIWVEAAANPRFTGAVTDLGDPLTAPRNPLYRLDQAELAVLETEIHELILDIRVLHELAQTLAESEPRRHQIRRALEEALDELDLADIAGSAPAARARLAPALRAPAHASAHQVSAVGHAHIDSAWLWPVRETIRKCSRTFANVTALAEEYPDLRFACSSAQQYAWMKAHHPQIWERIRRTVESGQFIPVGGMWVESDTNLPGGEALVRQITQGTRFFRDELGMRSREIWLPDSFGYTAALPQLARLAGYRWFLSQKMSWNQTNRFPHHTFWWEGIDGSRVFTHFPPADTYSAELSGAELARGVVQFSEHGKSSRSMLPFGYGDGGGGPTREMIETARRLKNLEGSPRVTIERPGDFFADAESEYPDAPVWSGEMYLEFHRGTYTSQVAMKQGNRRTEHLLREAELWSAAAAIRASEPYPYEELDSLWQEMLLLQFHDILPGSSIAWVHRQARQTYAELAERLEDLIGRAQQVLAGEGEVPLDFNSAPHARAAAPALGAAPVASEPAPGQSRQGRVRIDQSDGCVTVDNGVMRLRVAADGTIDRITDLVADREVLPEGARANVLQQHPDLPNRFDAWDLDEFHRNRCRDLDSLERIEVVEEPGGSARVTVLRRDGDSTYRQTLTLDPGRPVVDFHTEVDWHQQETLLKVAFPVDVHAETSAAEIQFGHLHRPTHTNTSWDAARFEIVAHRWLHVGEPGYGVALANAGIYGHDVTRTPPGDARGAGPTTVRLSLLRGPRYPDPQTDQGKHSFRYSLVVGADIADAVREGYRMNLPVRRRNGAAPVEPLVQVVPAGGSPDAVVVEAVKLADDRSGDLIVRLYESLGGRATARIAASFPISRARVVDLMEDEVEEIASLAHVDEEEDGSLRLGLRPFQVLTLRLEVER